MKLILCRTAATERPKIRKPHFSNENQTFQFSTYQDHQTDCGYQHDDRRIKRFRLKHGNHIFRSESNNFMKGCKE